MYFIGIDLGTSAVKLLLADENGKICNVVSKEYPVCFPHSGWSEQSPEDWFKQSVEGMKDLLSGFDAGEVKGISFGGQMHGLVMLDANDEVIRPAILWNDGRSYKETDYLNTVIGKAKLSELTGNIAFAGFTAPKVLWVKNNEPSNFAKIAKIMLPKDYLAYKLSGTFATDVSDASGTLYFDVKNRTWSKEMCEICSIKPEWLPKVFESYEKIGTLVPSIASELGIPETCVIAAGAGDNAAAAVGMGIIGNGGCNISLGTSGTIFMSNDKFGVDENNALHSFCHADGGFHLMGCMLSAASCNKWWMEEIVKDNDFKTEQSKITKLGENRVFFLPYLMGERSPINDPDARGCFIGMSMDTKREDMTQAVFEGVAFALKDQFEAAASIGVKFDKSCVCGGGAKSPLWRQIIADVLDITLVQTENEEGPALGGVILAGVAAGVFADVEEACGKFVKTAGETKPTAEGVAAYKARYEEYKRLYPALKSVFALNAGKA